MVQSLGLIGFLTVILWAPLLTLEDKPDNWNQDGWITAFKIHSGYENGTTNWYWYYHNNENACVENGVTSEHVCEAMKQACLTNTILNFFLIISFVMSICALCWSIWQLKGYMHRMCNLFLLLSGLINVISPFVYFVLQNGTTSNINLGGAFYEIVVGGFA